MKMNKMLKNINIIVSLILLNSFIFSFNNKNYDNYIDNKEEYLYSASYSDEIAIDEKEGFFNSKTYIFTFSSLKKINLILIEGNINLLSYNVKDLNNIECEISGFNDEGEGIISFYNGVDKIGTKKINYVKDKNEILYFSFISMDNAKRNAGIKLNYNLNNSDDDISQNHNVFSSTNSIGVVGSVSGQLKWTDEQGNTYPLIGAKVKITISGSWWSSFCYTDYNGYYKIEYNDIWYIGSGKPSIHIYTEGENVKVINNETYEHNYEFSGSSGDWNYDYIFSPSQDSDMGKAMMIFQGVKNYADYAKYLNNGSFIDFCAVSYPSDAKSNNYDRNGTIYLIEALPKYDYSPSIWSSWDVLGHEYGHHVQYYFNIIDSPGGEHYIPSSSIDYRIEKTNESINVAKMNGLKQAWGEGWPTYWSTIAQKHFDKAFLSIYTVGDNKYTSTNGFNYDISTITGGYGDSDERVVQCILYRLYDTNTNDFDKFGLGELKIWNLVIKNKITTLNDFIIVLYAYGYNKFDLGLLLNKFNVINNNLIIQNNFSLDNPPTFARSSYLGSKYIYYDIYDLIILDNNKNIIKEYFNISFLGKNCSYSISNSDRKEIMNNSDNHFYVYLVARQSLSIITGNYYSSLFAFSFI